MVKKNPLAPESAMPVWEIGSWGGLLAFLEKMCFKDEAEKKEKKWY